MLALTNKSFLLFFKKKPFFCSFLKKRTKKLSLVLVLLSLDKG